MNLKSLTDLELDAAALRAATNERAALVVLLKHIAEVNIRKSFSPRYQSITDYTVQHLGYDAKSAWRRVNAMFLMCDLPEITQAIETGKLDLTKMVLAQNHFRNETKARRESPPAKEEKIAILESVMAKSSREAERELISQSSAPEKLKCHETVKPLMGHVNEVRLVLSDGDLQMMRELKNLIGHRLAGASNGEIVSVALTEALAAVKKEKSGKNLEGRDSRRAASETTRSEHRRNPGRALSRAVYIRADGRCELCQSTAYLENDHRTPFAHGGKTTLDNLRLLCRNCNQREAIKIFGSSSVRSREVLYRLVN